MRFTDHSERAIELSWDFNNDRVIDSTDINPVYIYTNPRTYTVSLIASNDNGRAAKTATIKVSQPSSPNCYGNGHRRTGTGKAVVIHCSIVSNYDGTGETGDLIKNKNKSPGSEQNGGNTVENIEPISKQKDDTSKPANENREIPSFEIICGITALLTVYLYRKK